MGYMIHHAILVTSDDENQIREAHQKLTEISINTQPILGAGGVWVSPISPKTTNGYQSFFVSPDGSKEGWDQSYMGDRFRDEAIKILNSFAYEDKSTSIKYAEVQYGDDENDNRVLRASR